MPEDPNVDPSGDDLDIDAKIAKAVENLKVKHGSADAVALDLTRQNFKLREKNRELSSKLPDGSVVIKDEDAKLLNQYRELGDPKDVRKALDAGKTSTAQAQALLREKVHAEAAELNGLKPTVFKTLAKDREIVIEDEKADGKDSRVAYVIGVDAKGQPTKTPLDKFVEKEWQEFLPSLKASRTPGTPPAGSFNTPPPIPGQGQHDERRALMASGRYSKF